MNSNDERSLESERSFEELLGRADPRPMPSAADIDAARSAIRAEWRDATRQRRRRRHVSYAAAAGLLIGIVAVLAVLRPDVTDPVGVASIHTSSGTIYLLGEAAELEALADPDRLVAGQTIETAGNGSLGMHWQSGGSLRVDASTRVRFVSPGEIDVLKGRVYFDAGGSEEDSLRMQTPHGSVSHVGTQYMIDVSPDRLAVSVREGRVAVEGRFHDAEIEAGQRATIEGSRAPQLVAIAGYGGDWQWIEATAAQTTFDGRPAIELVDWAVRETGLAVEYSSAAARRTASDELLEGNFSRLPRAALRQALLSVELEHRIDDGVITISATEAGDD